MHPAARLQFERVIDEYAKWRAIAESERPPAPAWWWGPSLAVRELADKLPPAWCARLGLPDGAVEQRRHGPSSPSCRGLEQ